MQTHDVRKLQASDREPVAHKAESYFETTDRWLTPGEWPHAEDRPVASTAETSAVLTGERTAPTIHHSSTLRIDESMNLRDGSSGFVEVCECTEPGPRVEIVDGLIFQDCIQILSGHSGLGKSYVVQLMCMQTARGAEVLGRKTRKSNVLWLDAEMDRDEFVRRSYQICRGLGLKELPRGLYYRKLNGPLGDPEESETIRRFVSEHGIGLVAIDSLSIGAAADDITAQRDTVRLMKTIASFGTVIAIDHITKASATGNHRDAEIFGSVFKRAIARSTLKLTKAEGGGLTLYHDKTNFGPIQEPLHFAMDFVASDEMQVEFRLLKTTDPEMAGVEKELYAHEKVLLTLERLFEERGRPIHVTELADACDMKERNIRNMITKLGPRVKKCGGSTYAPSDSFIDSSTLRTDE